MTGERLDGGRVKGSLLSAHLECARDYGSRREFIEFFEEIPDSLRRQVSAVAPGVWYPFSSLIALDRLIIERFGGGDILFAEEVGTYLAQRSCAALSRFTDGPHEFFSRAPFLHSDWYDFLSCEYIGTGRRSGTMLHRGYRAHSLIDCGIMAGFYREGVRLHGGSDVTIGESACRCRADAFCAFDISWK